MSKFIEITDTNGDLQLINTDAIENVIRNEIYMQNVPHFATDYICFKCKESYEELKAKILEEIE